MRISTNIAGFSKADSDNFRRIISKKKLKEMPKQREWFIHGRKLKDYDYEGKLRDYKTEIPGAVALGHDEGAANELFDKMVDFASYAFNKSHAAAYAVVGYATAWLLYYYPVEYMASMMTAAQGNRSKLARYINYARKTLNIDIVPPGINESEFYFKPTKDGKIVYTLSVKSASSNTLQQITKERNENGPYTNMLDFVLRTRTFLDKSTYEALIASDCFKEFNIKKSEFLAALDDFWDDALKKVKEAEKRAVKSNRQFDFKERLLQKIDGVLPKLREYPKEICIRLEKEFLGLYLTDHPLYKYSYSIQNSSNFNLSDLEYDVDEDTGAIIMANTELRNNQGVKFVGIVNEIVEITTKKKSLMARVELEDLSGIYSAVVWPSTYSTIKPKLTEDSIYMIYGTVKLSDEAPTLIIDSIELMEDIVVERAEITLSSKYEGEEIINFIKHEKMARGLTPLYLKYGNSKVLLSKNYWINLPYMQEKFNINIITY